VVNEILTNGIMLVHHLGNEQLSADTVNTRHKHGRFVLLEPRIVKRTEEADVTEDSPGIR
jgi:hypothetical protein